MEARHTNYIFDILDGQDSEIILSDIREILYAKHHSSFAQTVPLLLREKFKVISDCFRPIQVIFKTHLSLRNVEI